jgi:hypothetical protein
MAKITHPMRRFPNVKYQMTTYKRRNDPNLGTNKCPQIFTRNVKLLPWNWETLNPIKTFQFQFFEQKRAIEIPTFK